MKQIAKSLLLVLLFVLAIPFVNAEEANTRDESRVSSEEIVTATIICEDYEGNQLKDYEYYAKGSEYTIKAKEYPGYVLMSEDTFTGVAEKDFEVTFKYNPVADLFIRIDAKVQYENGTTSYSDSEYYYVGTTTVTGKKVYDETAHKANDINLLIALNERVENEITTEIKDKELIQYLNKTYSLNLTDNQDIIWYVLKYTTTEVENRSYKDANGKWIKVAIPQCIYHIDGVIVNKGNVITNYVDDEGKVLANPTTDSYFYGQDYKTTSKSFNDYELIKVEGEETGTVNTPETTVTYVYQYVMGEGGDEDEEEYEVVQTGTEVDYSLMSSALITLSLIGIALYSKKKNN